ncbi:chromosome segregation protein SMC [Streptomyces lunaelactis]|uniref:Chromosome segregation protein SMC n=1 Tax=Streptomyces lunaelactis TaxID=1535768 RepID=A0A2R4T322_9ACTN|nr:AAA family ATPase [Streptomyces lunaelactis]AVZ73467.1 chromosome segregation protein SMC [Streptomyces lunaelactis]NUK89573.1 AAA family ATPase [Streptomyces lunaelactis]
MPYKISEVSVEGFTSIRAATLTLGDVTVLVGANGAGKSNVVGVLELLGRMADSELGLAVGLRGGAQALQYVGPRAEEGIRLRVTADPHSYEAHLVPAANDSLIFAEEKWGRPPEGLARGHKESQLPGPMRSVLGGCRVFHFHDTSVNAPVKTLGFTADNEALRPDARNLAAFLLRLREGEPKTYRRIVRAVQTVAPFFRDFLLAEEPGGKIRLRWMQQGVDAIFPAEALSDGTLRYICLCALLLQPDPPALLTLDEPELGLHPHAVVQLADLLRSAAVRSQVVIATQSVTLLNQFSLDDLVVAEREDGGTALRRPDPRP